MGVRCFIGLAILALAAALAPAAASAGAFLQLPGAGQVILGATFTRAGRAFDARGRSVRRTAYRKSEVQAYAEYGLSEAATLIVSPSLMQFHAAGSASGYAGLSESEIGAKVRLLLLGPAILSAQATLRSSGDVAGRGESRLAGPAGLRADLRLMAGTGFQLWDMSGFADAEAGIRTPARQRGAEAHADLTAGIRPVPSVLLMAQSFSTLSARIQGDRGPRQTHKLQLSAVFDIAPAVSVQLGGFAALAGRNAPRERGAVTAVWLRF